MSEQRDDLMQMVHYAAQHRCQRTKKRKRGKAMCEQAKGSLEKAIEIQQSILADLEELVICCDIPPKRTIEQAVYHRIAKLKKTIALNKTALAQQEEGK